MPVILCVEDEDDLRTDIAEELEEAGYAVIEARNGEQALAQVRAARPDLILCDINMPGQSGYSVLRALREQRPDLAEVPFIFLTALADPREVIEGKRAGADDYIVKPIDFDLMLATIEARLREVKRIQRQAAAEIENVRAALGELHGSVPQDGNGWATRALDYIALGVAAIDGNGRVLFANRAVRRLVQEGDAMLVEGTLRPSMPQHRKAFREAIEKAVRKSRQGKEVTACLRLSRPSGGRDLMVVVSSLLRFESAGGDAAAVVFVADTERRPPVPGDVLTTLFGLTPTESQVAIMLAEGFRLDEIAASLDVSSTTIAFHKRNLFQKTNTNRQADLIALVLAGPMAMVLE